MILLKVISIVLALESVTAVHNQEKNKDKWGHLKKIPRKFEVKAENAKLDFKRIVSDIQDLTAGKNITVLYRVKVDVVDHKKKINKKLKVHKKIRTKKYNVPLKKQSMKLSNFDALLRKLSDDKGHKPNSEVSASYTTNMPFHKFMTTKQMLMKFKPILSGVKTHYVKIIKPVRNKVETLTF